MAATAASGFSFKAFWNHPAGPKTSAYNNHVCFDRLVLPHRSLSSCSITAVHFWAPTMKWGISIANLADMQRPPEQISLPQQLGKSTFNVCSHARQAKLSISGHGLPILHAWYGSFYTLRRLSTACPSYVHDSIVASYLLPGPCFNAHLPSNPPPAITCTGVIWSRYSTQITPVNYNLLTVNLFM